ncbi:MAG: 3-deoxy-manno-octulosonate cytidylyltransferase [Burkholderiales bacterium]|jgi:3-deoxy-manno-octulosonate cytidylyltransferase (CMP-KDO synthetase)|nr:3-deoxy-manno-octulosonate cytidylyltransferase [Burkholderiales bacterium]
MNTLALIPARMGSSRFPGKPMALIMGKPMIGHVFERVAKSSLLNMVAVATCDREIFEYIESIGGKAVMTANTHERASDRCAEALVILEQENMTRFDIVVMVQGDEPLMHTDMISEAVQPMLDEPDVEVVNLIGEISDIEEFESRNCVKVVCDRNYNALYFSREPIPTRSKSNVVPMRKQVCIIPFRRDYLLEYTNLIPTPLEIAESIDMLRVLESGGRVRMAPTRHLNQSVDTPEDLLKVEALMRDERK